MDIVLRKWNRGDAPALSLLLDGIDRRYLSDRLPRPYTLTDGEQWLDMVLKQEGKAGIFRAVMVDGNWPAPFPWSRRATYTAGMPR